ncbi:MAG: hypothetical protein KJZ80_16475 [Hyphomicrobiaceae bacterium]|nr:hypothetical protein [Hyphomicrobiaceae bacterium]
MFGLDYQMDLARAWGDAAFGCMTAAAQVSTALFGMSATARPAHPAQPFSRRVQVSRGGSPQSGASWYRAPQSNPFDVTMIGMAWPFPLTTPSIQPVPAMLQALQFWTSLFGLPMTATSAMPAGWPGWPYPVSWPMPVLPWTIGMDAAALMGTRSSPASHAPFATYRSDSGHAVAQITFPNSIVAAVAVPSAAAPLLDHLFAWPLMLS